MCNFMVGLCGIFAAVIFLLWNEGRAVHRAQLLDEALSKCHPLTNTELVFDSNNGHLVHLTGPLTTDELLEDTHYGVRVSAVRLQRRVEMYQWIEHSHSEEYKEDGETKERVTYDYTREWRTELVDSSFFAEGWYNNPSTFPISQKEWRAQQTTVGSFYLSPALVELISNWRPLQLSLTDKMVQEGVRIHDNLIYHSHNPWSPQVGDLRIKYKFAGTSGSANPADHVSIIARQSLGAQLTTYYSEDIRDGILLLHFGIESHEEMLSKEHASNIITTWLYRGIGWCATFIGFFMLTNFGRYLDFPVIREVVSCGLLITNLLLASSVTLASIAIGWLRYHPLIAIVLFSAATIPYMAIKQRGRNPKSN